MGEQSVYNAVHVAEGVRACVHPEEVAAPFPVRVKDCFPVVRPSYETILGYVTVYAVKFVVSWLSVVGAPKDLNRGCEVSVISILRGLAAV